MRRPGVGGPFWVALGQRLRDLRLEAQLSQATIAKRVATSRPNVARVERGTHALSLALLERFARALGTTPVALLEHVYAQDLSAVLPTHEAAA